MLLIIDIFFGYLAVDKPAGKCISPYPDMRNKGPFLPWTHRESGISCLVKTCLGTFNNTLFL